MCVILVCPKNIRPSMQTLRACAEANPHGAGIAWRERGRVRWVKSNDVAEIYRLAQAKRGEIVIHFRIASVGRVCDGLRHPFPVNRRADLAERGSAKAVLFQNGTWPEWKLALDYAVREGHALPEGEMSDARAAAFLCSIYGRRFLEACTPSRWVFYSATETALFGHWHKIGGMLFSNTYWRVEPARSTPDRELELWDMSAARQ